MAKLMKNKIMRYNDSYYGDFSLDVLRLSRHATQRANEREIPVAELLKPRSHINGHVDKVVAKNGIIITVYPRINSNYELPANGRRFAFPKDGIGLFIGKQYTNIKRIRAEHQLKDLYFDEYKSLIAIAPTSDYDWTPLEKMIEAARKRKYKSKQQLSKEKNEWN